jgi:hypothetical protein
LKNAYKKYITESALPIYVAIIYSIFLRGRFYLEALSSTVSEQKGGYLWNPVQLFLTDNPLLLSYIFSFIFTLAIALFISRLNTKYTIIRKRTHLPVSFAILLLSAHPQLAVLTPTHFGLLFFFMAVNKLFSSYQSGTSPRIAFDFGFYFACGSLFVPDILFYLLFFWMGLSFMRSFTFKSILTSLLGIVSIYWLTLFYFLSMKNIEEMYEPFLYWGQIENFRIPFTNFDYLDFGIIIFSIAILTIMIVNNYAENYKDKIRVRGNIAFLNTILIVSILLFLLLPFHSILFLAVGLASASLVLSHFFALTNKRWQMYLFYITIGSFLAYTIYIFLV